MFIYCVFGCWHLAAGHVLFLIWTCTCDFVSWVLDLDHCLWLWVSRVLDLDHCLCVVALPACELWCTAVSLWLVCYVIVASLPVNCDVLCVVASFWFCVAFIVSSVYASMHGCNYCVELTVLSGYMYIDVSDFVLSIPDRNRHVPDRSISFPISRNIEFVFPSGFPVPATVPGHIMQEREWLRCFPDRSRPFSTLLSVSQYIQWWHLRRKEEEGSGLNSPIITNIDNPSWRTWCPGRASPWEPSYPDPVLLKSFLQRTVQELFCLKFFS